VAKSKDSKSEKAATKKDKVVNSNNARTINIGKKVDTITGNVTVINGQLVTW